MDPDRDLTYVDDMNEKDRNDRDYGQWGNAGYDIDLKAEGSVILLTAPVYTIALYFYQPPDFAFERRDEILQILDAPLEIREVRSGSPQPSSAGTVRALDSRRTKLVSSERFMPPIHILTSGTR
jgi:hypothetical protein